MWTQEWREPRGAVGGPREVVVGRTAWVSVQGCERDSWCVPPHVPALCDMHPMRALFLIPRNPPPRLKSKKW